MMNLLKALSYKEWMKTRKLVGGWILLLAAVSVYAYIDLTYTIRMNEAVNVWFGILFQGTSVSALLMYLLPLAGISLAIVQFVPEMTQKRFKLTLHLPASESRLVSSMLLFGYGVLGVLYLCCLVFLSLLVSRVLPFEGVSMMLSQVLPWTAAGLAGYGFTAWICIEPCWKQRAMNMLMAAGLLSVCFVSVYPEVYAGFGWGMAVLVAASFVFPFYSCIRFKQGVQ